MKRVAVLVKTDLKFDGRVIAEIDTLSRAFPSVEFKIFLLPDRAYENVLFSDNVTVELINVFTRKFKNKRQLIVLTTLLYGFLTFYKLLKYKPNIVHVHDVFPIPGVYFYSLFSKVKLIYDDHELFKQNSDVFHKLLYQFEVNILRKAEIVLVANSYRKRILVLLLRLNDQKIVVLENYNHLRSFGQKTFNDQSLIDNFKRRKAQGERFILHQGMVSEGRGVDYLVMIANAIPPNVRIIFMGISDTRYSDLTNIYPVLIDTSENIGFKPYEFINEYWAVMNGAIVLYDTKEINNKYCAPNRLYLALSNKIPLLVNKENPVLASSVKLNNAGVSITKENLDIHLREFFTGILNGSFYLDPDQDFSFKNNSAPTLLTTYERLLF
ncbi:MAG: glycosyltransferase involved in cell wall biosynthesis [Marivirga sp.]|jgi:glycosyltransferase involved in cell wall biosynthesis